MTQAVEVNPEGTLKYLRVSLLLMVERYAEAESAALEAADTPALFPIRRQALLCAALAQGMRYLHRPDPALRSRIAENLRKMLTAEPTRLVFRPDLAVTLALGVEEFHLARMFLDDWQRQDPGHPALPQIWADLRNKENVSQKRKEKEEREKKAPAKRAD